MTISVHKYIFNIQSVTVTTDSQKTLLEQMKVSRALNMSSNVCTYIHFQHTECTSNNVLTENVIGTDESKLCIGHE